MHVRRACLLSVAALACCIGGVARAARVDTGDLLTTAQPPFSNVLLIGVFAGGTVTIDGGTQAEVDAIALGALQGASGSLLVTGAGSKLTTVGDPDTRASAISVGYGGDGTIEVTDGGVVEVDGTRSLPGDLAASFGIALQEGSTGGVTISGAGSRLLVRNGSASSPGLSVGYEGGGSLDIQGGGVVQVDTGAGPDGGVTVGSGPRAYGSLTAAGDGSALELVGTGTGLTVGNQGRGTLTLAAGARASAQNGFVGLQAGGDGTIEIRDRAVLEFEGTNPQLGFGGSLAVGLAGTGVLSVSDAEVVLANQDGINHGLVAGGATACAGPCPYTGGSGEVRLDGPGASLRIQGPLGGATIGADGAGSLDVDRGAAFVVEDGTAGGVIVAGTRGSTGAVDVRGAGSTLDAGSGLLLGVDVQLADAGDARATVGTGATIRAGGVLVGTNGRLEGDGVVAADVENRGTIAPGAGLGTLAVQGSILQNGGRLRMQLAGVPPAGADRLDVSGSLFLVGGEIRLDFVDGYLPAAGDEIVIASAAGGVNVDAGVATTYKGAGPGFAFEMTAQGNELRFRALSDAPTFGACQVAQLEAFAAYCEAIFSCQAAFGEAGRAREA